MSCHVLLATDGLSEEDTQDGSGFESDGSWKQLLQYRGIQPTRKRTKNSTTDASVKQKNIKKLRNAMMMSYRQHEGGISSGE